MTDLYIYTALVFILVLAFGYLIGLLYAYRLLVNTKDVKVENKVNFEDVDKVVKKHINKEELIKNK